MAASTKTADVKAISRVAGILAEIELAQRRDVMGFLELDGGGTALAKVAVRVAGVLEDLDDESRERVVGFFKSQLSTNGEAARE